MKVKQAMFSIFQRNKRQLLVYLAYVVFIYIIIHTIASSYWCMTFYESNQLVQKLDLTCSDTELKKGVEFRGDFIVFQNYIRAERQFKCLESITLTTPGDSRYLDNIIPLVDRWRGPISVALYTPGYDFYSALQNIAYLRNCTTPLVKEFVTFHLFFEAEHIPVVREVPLLETYEDEFDCSQKPPFESIADEDMYKQKYGLYFPINVARNVAKLNVQTHFVFPSDIELYPTRNFIPKFFDFMQNRPHYFRNTTKNVFVLPIFEILAEYNVPETKTELREMLKNKTAFSFHVKVCRLCHYIPKRKEWVEANETNGLNIFSSTKRQGFHKIWEPFFVCTQKEPLWDERLNWEGQGNKMCQAFYLCILDYDFRVFDNAFLIHKPGVKKKKIQNIKYKDQHDKNNKILKDIQDELRRVYGTSSGNTSNCVIHSNA